MFCNATSSSKYSYLSADYREKVNLIIIGTYTYSQPWVGQDGYTIEEIDVWGVENGQEVVVAPKVGLFALSTTTETMITKYRLL